MTPVYFVVVPVMIAAIYMTFASLYAAINIISDGYIVEGIVCLCIAMAVPIFAYCVYGFM